MTQDEAKRRFVELCKEFITRSNEIDAMTPFVIPEPEWWLEMMTVQRIAQGVVDKNKPVT